MKAIAHQQQPLSTLSHAVFGAAIAPCLVIPLTGPEPVVRLTALSAAAIIMLSWLNFQRVTVQISTGWIRVGYPVFNSRVPLERVNSIEVIDELSAWSHGGVGVRITLGKRGAMTYVGRTGPALRLISAGRAFPVVFTCDDPHKIIRAMAAGGCATAEAMA